MNKFLTRLNILSEGERRRAKRGGRSERLYVGGERGERRERERGERGERREEREREARGGGGGGGGKGKGKEV